MLKTELEKLVKKLQKENESLKKLNSEHLETIDKLTNNCVKSEKEINAMRKSHFDDEEVWANKMKEIKLKLKDITLVCETHLRVNYPSRQVCKVANNQPEFALEQEENNDTRLIHEVIEMCREEKNDKYNSSYFGGR